ncbi:MAG: hypothetical protein EOO09_11890 [Chitinophagaceae bacterium]|nr:MAG: hypothetical protein EOO09_11890 [Chitinophagaceae bacterium]
MYKDYLDSIVSFYHKQKDKAGFPQALQNPTRARLRKSCLDVIDERFEKFDIPVLKDFFGKSNKEEIRKAIVDIDLDRFRPLETFLSDGQSKPRDPNIELLGWLIDFPDRPHDRFAQKWRTSGEPSELENSKVPEPTKARVTEEVSQKKPTGETPQGAKKADKDRVPKRRRLLLWGLLLFFGLVGAAYWFGSRDSKSERCMVWKHDHFESISCDSSLSPAQGIMSASSKPSQSNPGKIKAVKTEYKAYRIRCQGTTKKGAQCMRSAAEGSQFCWQH